MDTQIESRTALAEPFEPVLRGTGLPFEERPALSLFCGICPIVENENASIRQAAREKIQAVDCRIIDVNVNSRIGDARNGLRLRRLETLLYPTRNQLEVRPFAETEIPCHEIISGSILPFLPRVVIILGARL
jgi:hypothetical protein